MDDAGTSQPWYSVRCLIRLNSAEEGQFIYEERVTLWRSNSLEVAIARAEVEATEHAIVTGAEYIGLAQGYHLFDDVGDGAEVFSLMRTSSLDADAYIDRFFDTGEERQILMDGDAP